MTRVARRRGPRVLAFPALLAVVTAVALAAGLVGQGAWDLLATAGLLLPVACAWRAFGRRMGLASVDRARYLPPSPAGHCLAQNAERA